MGGVQEGVMGGLNRDIRSTKNSDNFITGLFCKVSVNTTWQGIYLA